MSDADIITLADFSPAVLARVEKLEDDFITCTNGARISKHAIYKILPVLEQADPKARDLFVSAVVFGCFRKNMNDPAIAGINCDVQYKWGNPQWDNAVEDIISVCLTSDCELDFEQIRQHLDVSEVQKMNEDYFRVKQIEAYFTQQKGGMKNER